MEKIWRFQPSLARWPEFDRSKMGKLEEQEIHLIASKFQISPPHFKYNENRLILLMQWSEHCELIMKLWWKTDIFNEKTIKLNLKTRKFEDAFCAPKWRSLVMFQGKHGYQQRGKRDSSWSYSTPPAQITMEASCCTLDTTVEEDHSWI